MPDATFACPDLTTFCRLDGLGLEVVGQQLQADQAVLACRVVKPDRWCHRCGCEGSARDSVVRRLAHEPFGWRPTTLLVTVVRYRCPACGHVWRQDTSRLAEPRATLSRRGLRWALEAIVCPHLTVARVAEALGVAWNTATIRTAAGTAAVRVDTDTAVEIGAADLGEFLARPDWRTAAAHATGLDTMCRTSTTHHSFRGPRFKLPEHLVLVDELASTKVGKIDKKALRADIADRLAADRSTAEQGAPA